MKKLIIALSMLAFLGCAEIDQTERGVVLEFGKVDEVVGPGLTIYNCFFKEIVRIPVKTMLEAGRIEAGSKDLQVVHVATNVNYHIDENFVADVYSKYGKSVVTTVLQPKIKETVTGITPQYVPEDMLQKREEIRARMEAALKAKLDSAGSHIIVDGFTITEFQFSDAFNRAIEEKQVAEQLALKEQNVKKQVEYQNDQRVSRAKADSAVIALQMDALKKQNGKDYLTLKWIEKWDGKLPQVNGTNGTMPLIDMR